MKIILVKDDAKLGKRNSVIEVADSYARNVLIPKGIAVVANTDNMNKLKNQIEKEKREHDIKVAEAKELAAKITELKSINIATKCSDTGKMFGSVTTKDIAEKLNSMNINVKKQDITLNAPIKTFGMYIATIKFYGGVSVDLQVVVMSDNN